MELSLKNLRNISQNLLPHFLINFGWQKTMERLCEQVAAATDIKMIYTQNGSMEKALDQQSQIHIYFIIMELVNNIQKHAQASQILLQLNANSQSLTMEISHNGDAMDQLAYQEHLKQVQGVGLHSIAQRVLLLRANLHFSKDAHGGQIHIEIPIDQS
jgi:signal transduction histidine kinase